MAVKTTSKQVINRLYKEDMEIDSDTFKLEIANYSRNISFDDKRPILVGTEHCHFFHTYDSGGKVMTQCNYVGGHTHDVTITVDEKGNMIGECGPAKSLKPTMDNHTHKVTYLKSDRFKTRTLYPAAQEAILNLTKV